MTVPSTALSGRMRDLAGGGLVPDAVAAELREKAEAFDQATAGFFAQPQTVTIQRFMGCFARARKLWCNTTGEPLV